jgi:predicted metal-dependent hydrolase
MRKTKAVKPRSSTPKGATKGMTVLGAPVEVRRHPGARRLTLRVSRTRRAVIVTLPLQCDVGEAGPFISRNLDWVRARLDSLPQPVSFLDGAFMPLRGEPHKILVTGRLSRDGVVVQGPGAEYPELRVSGDADHAPRRLRDWLASEARRDLNVSVSHHAKNLNVAAKRIAIRDQTSRWGSCSTTGVLSFSWRLIMAPPAILDYVAAHEVAHLREMNHGPGFWALVRKTYPDMAEAKRWLQIYGMDLHRYGAVAT